MVLTGLRAGGFGGERCRGREEINGLTFLIFSSGSLHVHRHQDPQKVRELQKRRDFKPNFVKRENQCSRRKKSKEKKVETEINEEAFFWGWVPSSSGRASLEWVEGPVFTPGRQRKRPNAKDRVRDPCHVLCHAFSLWWRGSWVHTETKAVYFAADFNFLQQMLRRGRGKTNIHLPRRRAY